MRGKNQSARQHYQRAYVALGLAQHDHVGFKGQTPLMRNRCPAIAAALLSPLAQTMGGPVLAVALIRTDDTPIRILGAQGRQQQRNVTQLALTLSCAAISTRVKQPQVSQ